MATRSRLERVRVTLPKGFDPQRHGAALEKKISEVHGSGWEVTNLNMAENSAWAERHIQISEVQESEQTETIDVRLPKNVKPSDGEKMAAKLEDQYEGYTLTAWEPFLSYATLTKLTPNAIRTRGAIANALGVKPWDIQIQEEPDGGATFSVPRSYVPSRHEAKLQEVAESIIGREGWYVIVNPAKLTGRIVPANPPTFPGTLAYPFGQKMPKFDPKGNWGLIPLGVKLGKGDEPGEQLCINLGATAHGQVAGISGGGKTVAINAFAYGLLAREFELCVVDAKHKAVDYEWLRPYVRDGGWGCESIAAGVASLSLVIQEGERRAKLIKEHKVQKWQELPASLGIRPIAVILDEVTALFMMEEVPKGLPKEHELVIDSMQANLEKAVLKKLVAKIAAEWRFAGVSIFVCTQMAQNNTGVPPTIKINLGNRILFGANPNDAARGHAFMDARNVPKVPVNIQVDSVANRGVGAAELEGQGAPSVFKAYFATTEDYAKHLEQMGAPKTRRPEPTATEIARFTPSLESLQADDRPPSRIDREGGFGQGHAYDEPRLRGAAAAAHDLKVAENQMKARERERIAAELED